MTVFNFQYSDLILKIGGQILFIIIVLLIILSETSILQSPLNIFKKYGTNAISAASKASASSLASASNPISAASASSAISAAKGITSPISALGASSKGIGSKGSLMPGFSGLSAIFNFQ